MAKKRNQRRPPVGILSGLNPFAPYAAKLASSEKRKQWPQSIEVAQGSKSEKFDGLDCNVDGESIELD